MPCPLSSFLSFSRTSLLYAGRRRPPTFGLSGSSSLLPVRPAPRHTTKDNSSRTPTTLIFRCFLSPRSGIICFFPCGEVLIVLYFLCVVRFVVLVLLALHYYCLELLLLNVVVSSLCRKTGYLVSVCLCNTMF